MRTHLVRMYILTAGCCVLNHFVISDSEQPLLLTPMINAGNIKQARELSRVEVLQDNVDVESYSGYLTVDERHSSNLFFWFFLSEQTDWIKAPLILWLQGGPGASSLIGLFNAIGPYVVNKDGTLEKREYYWSQLYNVLFIDNPVSAGFSYTNDEAGYPRNESALAENLYTALTQFFLLFPELKENTFYITGESYAGKYIPALGYTIHIKNAESESKINLQGMAIGNGMVDMEHQMLYGDYLYQLGIIDENLREYFHQKEDHIVQLIQQERWEDGFWAWEELVGSDTSSTLYNETGYSYHYNYLHHSSDPMDNSRYLDFVQKQSTRRSIHVGNNTFHMFQSVDIHLREDFMKSVRPWVEFLLEHYQIIVYNGQLDIMVGYPLTLGFLKHLNWSAAQKYRTAKRYQWYVGNELAGYVKTADKLTEVLVRNAGHQVPAYQPKHALELIKNLVESTPFY